MQALGYRQVAESLLSGLRPEETMPVIKRKTWQFAKRQITWFRYQLDVEWIGVGPADKAEDIANGLEMRYLQK
jgi:tRNA dimethylallyltransferase